MKGGYRRTRKEVQEVTGDQWERLEEPRGKARREERKKEVVESRKAKREYVTEIERKVDRRNGEKGETTRANELERGGRQRKGKRRNELNVEVRRTSPSWGGKGREGSKGRRGEERKGRVRKRRKGRKERGKREEKRERVTEWKEQVRRVGTGYRVRQDEKNPRRRKLDVGYADRKNVRKERRKRSESGSEQHGENDLWKRERRTSESDECSGSERKETKGERIYGIGNETKIKGGKKEIEADETTCKSVRREKKKKEDHRETAKQSNCRG